LRLRQDSAFSRWQLSIPIDNWFGSLGGLLLLEGRREPMPVQSRHDALVRRTWLLNIGRLLQTEYSAVAQPVSERLAALLEKIETGENEH
jgi:hypothetical protein